MKYCMALCSFIHAMWQVFSKTSIMPMAQCVLLVFYQYNIKSMEEWSIGELYSQ